MDLLTLERAFSLALRAAVRQELDLDVADVPLSYPPDAELGDIATPVCFELAKRARRPPREIAERVARALRTDDRIARVEVAGAGYVNAFLDRQSVLRRWLAEDEAARDCVPGKTIVEHTNINPNKAAHIGHLRNAVLGDTLVRFLRRLGHVVEVQNYIDDTGVQVADLVVGFLHLRGQGAREVREQADRGERSADPGSRFDYLAWELYAEVTRFYDADGDRLALRHTVLEEMEQGGNPTAELAAFVSQRMVQHHLATMDRIGVRYDLLPHESDILRLRFWDRAFRLLRESNAVLRVDNGKNAGCWVMNLTDVEQGSGEDQKVIVRSNGTVTYVGKDIAYQLWKFGLLARDFAYTRFDWRPAQEIYPLWATCSTAGETDHPPFGRATRVYNVIDTRQSYLQRVVHQGLERLGYRAQAAQSIHYSYEMVALTPAAVAEIFPEHPLSAEDRTKAYLEMSGRKGLGVRADDLLDRLETRAADEVRKRNPDGDPRQTARCIAVAALRYYMLRYSRNRVVAFDLDAALAFEGETGPYLQYTIVRARNILAKVAERHGAEEVERTALAERAGLDGLSAAERVDHWNLLTLLLRVDAVVRQSVEALELSGVAKHAYLLAQSFNSFYHKYPVAQEARSDARSVRAAVVRLYHDEMVSLLGLMGIDVPDRM
ncbi:MAG TPA: arginine--tRNA ligase [Candidatus Polarisedimenticolaceae bacterium]|nr:arginine--tRNA ligase [Candidatus Polarisedimenticolaceae bacterium]